MVCIYLISRYDTIAFLMFYVAMQFRVLRACERCYALSRHLAARVLAIRNPECDADIAQAVLAFGKQLRHQPIRIRVLDGFMVLGYPWLKGVRYMYMAACEIIV